VKLPLFQVDAFTDTLFSGNPAAVCPLVTWLPDTTLQAIAEENNLSETAFYVSAGREFHIRWFTPTVEVDLCGHATLAAAHVILNHTGHESNSVHFTSKSGPLSVVRDTDYLVMDFPAQRPEGRQIPAELIAALGREPLELFSSADYMAVFHDEDALLSIQPGFELLKKLDLRGVIITAPGRATDFVSRFFAPKFGINEDPVTGSAHCLLAPYWSERLGKSRLTGRQLSQRGGEVVCEIRGDRVSLAGKAVTYLEGLITIVAP